MRHVFLAAALAGLIAGCTNATQSATVGQSTPAAVAAPQTAKIAAPAAANGGPVCEIQKLGIGERDMKLLITGSVGHMYLDGDDWGTGPVSATTNVVRFRNVRGTNYTFTRDGSAWTATVHGTYDNWTSLPAMCSGFEPATAATAGKPN